MLNPIRIWLSSYFIKKSIYDNWEQLFNYYDAQFAN